MKDLQIDFSKNNGLVPCIVQDADSKTVLMLGYMNEEALKQTLSSRKVTFFSRSKNRLWMKGETSGNYLDLANIKNDCDNDTLLVTARPAGPVCHTGADTCFNEKNSRWSLSRLEEVIADRKKSPEKESYTSRLFAAGLNKIAQKVGEEAFEVVIEAKDQNKELFLNESADLIFHFLVLLVEKGCTLEEVVSVLESRHRREI